MTDFTIKQNDTKPSLIATFKDDQGQPVDISGADVRFHLTDYSYHEDLINEQAEILDGLNGQVAYNWQPGDTAQAGSFKAEFEVIYQDGGIETFPNQNYIIIEVIKELA